MNILINNKFSEINIIQNTLVSYNYAVMYSLYKNNKLALAIQIDKDITIDDMLNDFKFLSKLIVYVGYTTSHNKTFCKKVKQYKVLDDPYPNIKLMRLLTVSIFYYYIKDRILIICVKVVYMVVLVL